MMSRPHSPFKRSSRPPSQSSPNRPPSRNTLSNHHYSEEMSPRAHFAAPGGNSGHGVGSSKNGGGVTMGNSYGTSLSRAEHYDVVLEGDDAAAILPYLGAIVLDQMGSIDDSDVQLDGDFDNLPQSGSTSSINAIQLAKQNSSGRASSDVSVDRFESMLEELLQTERSYVKRIETLYKRYAVPLRQLARDRDTAIIPLFEAQRLFGNIGEVVGANSSFLKDLENCLISRERGELVNLGDVVYRNIACFACYNEYFNNFEKAKHIEQTMTKTNRAYREFVDRTKASTTGLGNVGLRELIMEPVQRIPRYTMLLDGLVKNLPTSDPDRSRLEEAIVLASRIASCEVDDKTKRAAVLWSFARNVDGFPASLISVHRQFIDCVDVDDFPIDVLGPAAMNNLLSPASSSAMSPNYRTVHCTLFLFDDVIAITKRASASSCGRTLVGLDDLNKLADQMKTFTERSTNIKMSSQKVELGFRGFIELNDLQAVDLGGPDFQVAMAKGPSHISGDKWATRFVRQFATIDATSLSGPDPSIARNEKYRFLENLWRAQALIKAREFRSHVRCSVIPSSCDEEKMRRVVYWNVYSRRPYLTEPRKSLAVLHVDPEGQADRLPFGYEGTPPGAIVRIHEIVEGDAAECIISVSLKEGSGKHQEDEGIAGQEISIAMTEIAQTLYKSAKSAAFSIASDFEPKRGGSPSTPSSSHRGKNLATGLEQFGRSLFGTPNSIRSAGTGSDLFGTRRSRSKGSSSTFSRNPSTSTRMTHSTAATSSVGSRGMLGSHHLDVPCNDGIKSSIQRYRNMAGEDENDKAEQDSISPPTPNHHHQSNHSTPSPIKRKPVPSTGQEGSPQRVPSASKRALPTDATPTDQPRKRVASGRRSAGGVKAAMEEDDDHFNYRSVSPSPTRRPIGPRGASIASRSNSVAPLRVRKDMGQPRGESRGDQIQSTWKDLEALRESMVNSRDLLQSLQIQGGVTAKEAEDCTIEQENSAEILLRLRDSLSTLLKESTTAMTDSIKPQQQQAAAAPPASDKVLLEVRQLQAQVSSLTRKCELLSALEKDGRLENTELHKAFNEELDHLYEDAGLGEVEQIAKLRVEVKRAKNQRNEANIENKSLQRELALEKAQGEVWKALLETNGLI